MSAPAALSRPRIAYWMRLPMAREAVLAEFEALDGIDFTACPTLEACLEILPELDGLVLYTAPEAIARTLLTAIRERAPRLRWLHFLSAGKEGFDAVGIPGHIRVTQTPGASAPTVAEHAMALLLALCRQLPAACAATTRGQWDRGLATACRSLEGQQLTIVGYGQIGREVARRAKAFGMRVLAVSRTGKVDEFVDESATLDALSSAMATADAAVIAIAATPSTRQLIGAEILQACQPHLLLVNVARGTVLDQAALGHALRQGRLAGAGLDVTAPEPPDPHDPLWQSPNLIVSPHIAAEGSPASNRRMALGAVHQLQPLLAPGAPLSS